MNEITLTSRALKSTLVLDPAPLVGLKVPDGPQTSSHANIGGLL
jgi:hypothetical protein